MSLYNDGYGGVTKNAGVSQSRNKARTNTLFGATYKQKKDAQTVNNTQQEQAKRPGHGLSHIRPAIESWAGQYGLTKDDVNKNIKYDDVTGEVSVYGVNFGAPKEHYGGKTYYDTDYLFNKFTDTMAKQGKTKSPEQVLKEGYTGVNNAYSQYDDYIKGKSADNDKYINENRNTILSNTDKYDKYYQDFVKMANKDPFTSSSADAIYSIYGAKGRDAAGDAVASIAGSNSGNVDSYAAANARRQELAFLNAASEQILKNHQASLSEIREYAKDLGVQFTNTANALNLQDAQRTANLKTEGELMNSKNADWSNAMSGLSAANDARAFNNALIDSQKVSDDVYKATVTGEKTNAQKYADNPFFNERGELINPSIIYENLKQEALAAGDTDTVNYINEAINVKTQMPEYQQWARYVPTGGAEKTEAAREFEMNDATTRYGYDQNFNLGMSQLAANGANTGNNSAFFRRTGLNANTVPANINSGMTAQDAMAVKTIDALNNFAKQTLGMEYITKDATGNYYVAPENRETVKGWISKLAPNQQTAVLDMLGLNETDVADDAIQTAEETPVIADSTI
jgi:hypothetical protein